MTTLALLSLLVPFLLLLFPMRKRQQKNPEALKLSTAQQAENTRLYQERCDELSLSDLDDEQKTAMQLELDREFLSSQSQDAYSTEAASERFKIGFALSLFFAGCLSVWLLYQYWGAANELRASELLGKSMQAELSVLERRELVARLERAENKQPDNMEWRYLRARLLNADGDFAQAAEVFSDILFDLPESAKADRAMTMTLLAQARFFASDQKADANNYQLIKDALAITPNSRQALGIAGILAFELQRYREAINHWRTLWASLPAGQEANYLEQGIRRAAQKLEIQGDSINLDWLVRAEIKVLVSLSDTVKKIAEPDDRIFVLAKAIDGPAMPLAVKKLSVADLPQVVTLNDSQAMMATMSLSQYQQVTLVARLSKSGQPVAQPGDWQVVKTPVNVRGEGLQKLVIQQQVTQE